MTVLDLSGVVFVHVYVCLKSQGIYLAPRTKPDISLPCIHAINNSDWLLTDFNNYGNVWFAQSRTPVLIQ